MARILGRLDLDGADLQVGRQAAVLLQLGQRGLDMRLDLGEHGHDRSSDREGAPARSARANYGGATAPLSSRRGREKQAPG